MVVVGGVRYGVLCRLVVVEDLGVVWFGLVRVGVAVDSFPVSFPFSGVSVCILWLVLWG